MLHTCNNGGCHIKTIECNQEFQSVVEAVADDSGVDMNCANAQDHVAAAECNNCTIKELIHTTCHRSGYAVIPKQMIMVLAEHSVKQLNVFPAKHGISQCHSPETITTGRTVDCNKHCQHEFGTCAQAHDEPRKKKSVKERSIDSMCLRPTHSKQGGHQVVNLSTGLTLTHSQITPIPLTQFVKNTVEALAIEQGCT